MTEHDIDWDCEKARGYDWVLYSKGCTEYRFYKDIPLIVEDYWNVDLKPKVKCFGLRKRPAKKDEPENIYTQAMFNAGKECEVGMMFQTEAGQYTSLYQNKNCVVFEDEEFFLISISKNAIKPIDTRTDKQKLADQIDKYVIDKNINAIDTDKLIDAIMNGEFENLEYTGEK